jgi:hypothetical protein
MEHFGPTRRTLVFHRNTVCEPPFYRSFYHSRLYDPCSWYNVVKYMRDKMFHRPSSLIFYVQYGDSYLPPAVQWELNMLEGYIPSYHDKAKSFSQACSAGAGHKSRPADFTSVSQSQFWDEIWGSYGGISKIWRRDSLMANDQTTECHVLRKQKSSILRLYFQQGMVFFLSHHSYHPIIQRYI